MNQPNYSQDVKFLTDNNIQFIELKSADGLSRVIIASDLQGRVMTSTATGEDGLSFGWINYKLISSGEQNKQFNPYGGEERFWIGPEGGDFSFYFKKGKDQIFTNWKVPAVIDTESFDVDSSSINKVVFSKKTTLVNATGTQFMMDIKRSVSLINSEDIEQELQIKIPNNVNFVAYKSENKIKNVGKNKWTKDTGIPSIWMLSMFNPGKSTTVMIPFKNTHEGTIVNDNYFGKVPQERLIVKDSLIYFNVDGKLRSKIGVPFNRVKNYLGSYDANSKALTVVIYNLPSKAVDYVNSLWGKQKNPFSGDVVNSYNDGPTDDGTIMGPFYEIETSSPGADLMPEQSITHIQKIIHMQGEPNKMDILLNQLFGVKLNDVEKVFHNK